MTVRSRSSSRPTATRLYARAIPATLAALSLPFASPEGPYSELGIGLGAGAALAACGTFSLFVIFALIRPEGWSPRVAIEDAETFTYWMAALAAVSCVF
jgi:hypothetical protein